MARHSLALKKRPIRRRQTFVLLLRADKDLLDGDGEHGELQVVTQRPGDPVRGCQSHRLGAAELAVSAPAQAGVDAFGMEKVYALRQHPYMLSLSEVGPAHRVLLSAPPTPSYPSHGVDEKFEFFLGFRRSVAPECLDPT